MFKASTPSPWTRIPLALFLAGSLAQAQVRAPETRTEPGRVSARAERLAHFRRLQLEIRDCKKRQRALRKAAPRSVPEPSRALPGSGRPHLGGLFCLTLLGLGALAEPSLLATLAQTPPAVPPLDPSLASLLERYGVDAASSLDPLGPACAASPLAGRRVRLCDPDYRAGLGARIEAVRMGMARMFTEPAALGAGECLPGEPLIQAKERIALAQSDILADFDALGAGAAVLQYQLDRDGYALEAFGGGLLAAQGGILAAGDGAGASLAAFALGEAGHSLVGAGFGIQVLGDHFSRVANQALARRARYQRWANSQVEGLLNCTRTKVPAPAVEPVFPEEADGSPVAAVEDAILKLLEGCQLASRHGLALPVCSSESLDAFRERNGTVADLYINGVACLTAGILRGRQAPCPKVPLADVGIRSDTLAFFDEFAGEVAAAASDAFAFGHGLFAGSRALVVAAGAAARAGNAQEAAVLAAASNTLVALGTALTADGFDLLRIGALSRGWETQVIKAFNAESRSRLDAEEAREPAVSSTAMVPSSTGPALAATAWSTGEERGARAEASSTALAPDAPEALPPPSAAGEGSTGWEADPPSGTASGRAAIGVPAPEAPAASAAARTSPYTLRDLVRILRQRTPDGHAERPEL